MDNDVLIRQKHLPMAFLAAWLMIITTIQWIVLDMYLPALPILTREFGVSEGQLNISLNTGIIAAAVGTIVGGTLSDRYGRKSVILAGLFLGVAGNLFCGLAGGIVLLCVMRAVSGFGSGVVETVAAAMLKDSFSGQRFQSNMTLLQSVAAIGPIFAPVLGSILINVSSWRAIFFFLAGAILITMIPMFALTETLPEKNRFSNRFSDVAREAAQVARSPAFSLFLGIGALLTIPIWAYIAVSSYIFIDDFGVDNTVYGAYYAAATVFSVIAPFVFLLLSRFMKNRMIVRITLALMLISGILLVLTGHLHPVVLTLCIVPMYFSEGIIRPLSLIILLEEYSYVAGSASALIQFVVNVVGAVGTALATLGWSSLIRGTGVIAIGCSLVAIAFWGIICRKGLLKERLDR